MGVIPAKAGIQGSIIEVCGVFRQLRYFLTNCHAGAAPAAHENKRIVSPFTGGDKLRPYISMWYACTVIDVGEGFMPSRISR
jgi:hypothetical protein